MGATSYRSRCIRKVLRNWVARPHSILRIAASLLLLVGTKQLQAQFALDGFDPNADGYISVVVVQPDGKILIGGDFTTLAPNGGPAVTRNRIARLNPDGTVDPIFDPNASGAILAMAVQADGKILVSGYFFGANSIGGQTRNHFARLDPVTGLADSFDPNTNGYVYSIALQNDGKILVGGFFNTIGGQIRNNIARLDPITGLAEEFNPNANGQVRSILVQRDGKILVGGEFGGTNSIGQTGAIRNHIARLYPATGGVDSFNPNANNTVYGMALQADGSVLAAGSFTTIHGYSRRYLARIDATTGSVDLSFNPNPNDFVFSVAVQKDGEVLASGSFTNIGGQTRNYLARLDTTNGLADSFDANATSSVIMAVQKDGKILVAGNFTTIGGETRHSIARLETDGKVDRTLDLTAVGVEHFIFATAVQPDGKILIGGDFYSVLGVTRNNLARLNTDGTLDLEFDPNADNTVESIAVQTDGKIIAGGNFSNIGGQTRNYLARLDAMTGVADSFEPNPVNPFGPATIYAIALQEDGKIVVGGSFSSIGGQMRNLIARLDPITGLADSFDPNASSFVYSIAIQADGKILAGGAFSQIGQQTRNHIARLDPTTGLADSFDPNANGNVLSIVVQPDGKVLAGGGFNGVQSIGGQMRNRIARLDAATGLADSFDPNANGLVLSIALPGDGKVLVAGAFNGANCIGGQDRSFIARLDATTGLADSFDANPNAPVYGIALQADGKVLLSGQFDEIGGQLRERFARLTNDIASLQNFAASKTEITWTLDGATPQFTSVTFESSTNNVNYALLGYGIPQSGSSNWNLTGLSLPIGQNIYIRARGYYRSGYLTGSESIRESIWNTFIARSGSLGNISTRLLVQPGDNAMIGGFIITGTEPKTVVVRGIGPSLPIAGALADPTIEVHGASGELLASNDNWRDDPNQQHVIDSGLAPTNDLESALWGIINPGPYTVIVRGKDDTSGIGLFEVYDLDQTVDSKLANISTRGYVETGNNVMIGGTIIVGNDPARVLLRAIGPSLTSFGISNALPDPFLELRDSNGGVLASNDNWRSDQEAEIIATGIPPSNDLEAAIVRDLIPDNYTAIVRGVNGTTGVAVVEAYQLN